MAAPVTIAASAAVTACGDGLAPLERALADNTSALHPCPRFNGPVYQTNVAGAVPDTVWAQLRAATPGHADAPAFLLAHHVLRQLRPQATGRVGLVLSTTKADIIALERGDDAHRHILPGQLAADLAIANEIGGPVRCVSVACVSGLLAIQLGVELLHRDAADSVLVAGVDLLSDFVLAGFTALRSLDPQGCRPFDRDRAGLSLGEGAGALLLGRARPPGAPLPVVRRGSPDRAAEADRRSPILQSERATGGQPERAVGRPGHNEERRPAHTLAVVGWGSSNDANHLTGPSRDGSGLALAIQRALRRAGIDPGAVDFVHAHGTGTVYNDAMEALALRSVFGDRVPPFSSSKGLFGHTLGAAGILETIICLLAARTGIVPGTPRLGAPAGDVPATVQREPRPGVRLRTILKLNAGFGGTNAALVLQA